MKIALTSKQLATLSGFCGDVAKGLALASFLGQGISENTAFEDKIAISLAYLAISLLMIIFALILDRRNKEK